MEWPHWLWMNGHGLYVWSAYGLTLFGLFSFARSSNRAHQNQLSLLQDEA